MKTTLWFDRKIFSTSCPTGWFWGCEQSYNTMSTPNKDHLSRLEPKGFNSGKKLQVRKRVPTRRSYSGLKRCVIELRLSLSTKPDGHMWGKYLSGLTPPGVVPVWLWIQPALKILHYTNTVLVLSPSLSLGGLSSHILSGRPFMVHNSYRLHVLFTDFLNCLLCDLLKNSPFPPDTTLVSGKKKPTHCLPYKA